MTPAAVAERVAQIRVIGEDDDTAAHEMEDRLRHLVLVAIANGHPEAAVLAREALKTSAIEFARWCG